MHASPVIDHEAERRRLDDLIAGLATPEQMDEARMRRIAEAKKQQKQSKPAAEQTVSGEPGAGEGDSDEVGAAAGVGRRGGAADRRRAGAGGRGRSRRRRGGWVLPAAAAVLLIAALIALLLTGTIPNPWFGDETGIVQADNGDTVAAGDAATSDDEAAAEGDGEPTDADGSAAGDGASDGEGTAAGDEDTTGVDGAGAEDGAADGDGDDDGAITTDAGTPLPEGWPPDSLPALEALEGTPGVTITRDRVIGPGGIEITLNDIIRLVNEVATDNGYAPMGVVDPDRPDPDWIYPGNVFVLPNDTRYTVVEGDTLWEITVRYMVARLRQDYERYTRLVAEHEAVDTSDARRREIAQRLAEIGETSHTENFSRMVDEKLDQWKE